ncbi:MAG: hypothetical protein KatS3mg026_1621 [Bacteroidia bacterium]|nr:MAG: hypothetical protein KatS3mg026_1621 [Bacteroidia bacterium]
MWRKSWLWLLSLEACRPAAPPPPVAEDTVVAILSPIYAYKALLQLENAPPAYQESLLRRQTFHLLAHYRIDSLRWAKLRHYYLTYPDQWERLLDRLLVADSVR